MRNVTYRINNLTCIVLITFCSFLVHIVRWDHTYKPIVCCISIVTIMLQIQMSHFPHFGVQSGTAFMVVKSPLISTGPLQ